MNKTDSATNATIATFGSGILQTTVGHPLDMLRMRILFGNDVGQLSNLKKGILFSNSLSVVRNGCIWPIQEFVRKLFKKTELSAFQSSVLSGGISNLMPNVILAPLNITRVHLLKDHRHKTAFKAAQHIYRDFGISGFYKGLPVTILRDGIWGCIYFPLVPYIKGHIEPYIKDQIEDYSPNSKAIIYNATATFSSAGFATALTSWIDAIRLHQMNQDKANKKKFLKIVAVALAPTKNNILSTAWGVFRVALSTSVGHTSYLFIKNHLNEKK